MNKYGVSSIVLGFISLLLWLVKVFVINSQVLLVLALALPIISAIIAVGGFIIGIMGNIKNKSWMALLGIIVNTVGIILFFGVFSAGGGSALLCSSNNGCSDLPGTICISYLGNSNASVVNPGRCILSAGYSQ